jgi:hypothetical protein
LAAVAGLIVTIGTVATAITAILDLHDRFAPPNKAEKVSAPARETPEVRELREPGVRVTVVVTGSPADHAGVRVDDVITSLRGRRVEDADDYRNILKRARAGDVMLIGLYRKVQYENSGEFYLRRKFLRAKLQQVEGSNLLLGLQVEDVRPERVVGAEPPFSFIGKLVVLALLGFFMALLVVGFFWLKGNQRSGRDGDNSSPS